MSSSNFSFHAIPYLIPRDDWLHAGRIDWLSVRTIDCDHCCSFLQYARRHFLNTETLSTPDSRSRLFERRTYLANDVMSRPCSWCTHGLSVKIASRSSTKQPKEPSSTIHPIHTLSCKAARKEAVARVESSPLWQSCKSGAPDSPLPDVHDAFDARSKAIPGPCHG